MTGIGAGLADLTYAIAKRDRQTERQGWTPLLLSVNVDLSKCDLLRPHLASPKFLRKRETQTFVFCLESKFLRVGGMTPMTDALSLLPQVVVRPR